MPATGATCDKPGKYISICEHLIHADFHEGDRFPPCPEGSGSVYWIQYAPLP